MHLLVIIIMRMIIATTYVECQRMVISDYGDPAPSSAVKAGKDRYALLLAESKMPNFGSCWTDALNALHEGCGQITEESQSRMALSFTNCFLLKSGKVTYPCPEDLEIRQCIGSIDDPSFAAYTTFFTHTHDMCAFLQSRVWHQETRRAIVLLSETASKVGEGLEQALEMQDQMLSVQEKSLLNQNRLLEQGNRLSSVLHGSREDVGHLVTLFHRISKFQSLFLGEFSNFFSLGYHVIAVVLSFFLTSTARTRSARFWLFVILVLNYASERFVARNWEEDDGAQEDPDGARVLLYDRVWLCRKLSTAAAVVVLLISAHRYLDYNRVNYQLLEVIQRQNHELIACLKSVGAPLSWTSEFRIKKESMPSRGEDDSITNTPHLPSRDSTSVEVNKELQVRLFAAKQSYGQNSPLPTKKMVTSKSSSRPTSPSPPQLSDSSPRYNMRPRKSTTPDSSLLVVDKPQMFNDVVQHMQSVTRRNRSKVRRTIFVVKKPTTDFSSDDD